MKKKKPFRCRPEIGEGREKEELVFFFLLPSPTSVAATQASRPKKMARLTGCVTASFGGPVGLRTSSLTRVGGGLGGDNPGSETRVVSLFCSCCQTRRVMTVIDWADKSLLSYGYLTYLTLPRYGVGPASRVGSVAAPPSLLPLPPYGQPRWSQR